MPELPEVETVRRGLALKMTGRRIVRAELRRPDLRRPFPPELAERLGGAEIGVLGRRGKYILIELGSDGLLLLHLGMSGRITTGDGGAPAALHDHVVLTLDDGTIVTFNDPRRFGLLDYVRRSEAAQHPLLAGLGPEPLGPDFTGPYLAAKLAGKMTPIKSALLDQRDRRRARQHLCLRGALSRPVVAAAARRHDWPWPGRTAGSGDPRRARGSNRSRRLVIARLCADQWRTRLFPASLGGLWPRGRALPRLHLQRGCAPHRAGRPLDFFLRQKAALEDIRHE